MLRITITTVPQHTTVILEGRLCGGWVAELTACWQGLIATRDAGSIRIDLDGVTFVDAAGKAQIRAMHSQGAILVATDVMTRTILEEIVPDAVAARTRAEKSKERSNEIGRMTHGTGLALHVVSRRTRPG